MEENVVPGVPKDYDGPCRESASMVLLRRIETLRCRLVGLQELQKIAERAKPGSALESAIYDLLTNCRYD